MTSVEAFWLKINHMENSPVLQYLASKQVTGG